MKQERDPTSSKDAFSKQMSMPTGILLAVLFFIASLFSGCSSIVSDKPPNGAADTGSRASASDYSIQASEHHVTVSQSSVSVSEDALVLPSEPASLDSAKKDSSENVDCTESASPEENPGGTEEYASPEDTEKFLQDVLEQLDSYEDSLR